MSRILALEIECTPAQYADLTNQLDRQCIQTVEYSVVRHPSAAALVAVRVVPHFGDLLDPELIALISG